jgi:hypothetical protein
MLVTAYLLLYRIYIKNFLDMHASKAMKLRTSLLRMQQHRKMRKNYHLKRIGAHP